MSKTPYHNSWNTEPKEIPVTDHLAHYWDDHTPEDRVASVACDYIAAVCWEEGPTGLATFLRWAYESVFGGKECSEEDSKRFIDALRALEGLGPDAKQREMILRAATLISDAEEQLSLAHEDAITTAGLTPIQTQSLLRSIRNAQHLIDTAYWALPYFGQPEPIASKA